MIGLEVKMLLEEPEVWVPVVAVILERCRGNNEATSAVLMRLVSLGLVQAGVDPKRPDQLSSIPRCWSTISNDMGPG